LDKLYNIKATAEEKEEAFNSIASLLVEIKKKYLFKRVDIILTKVIKNFIKTPPERRRLIASILPSFYKTYMDGDASEASSAFSILQDCKRLLKLCQIIPFNQDQLEPKFIKEWFEAKKSDFFEFHKTLQIVPEKDRFCFLKEAISSQKKCDAESILVKISQQSEFFTYLQHHLSKLNLNSSYDHVFSLIHDLKNLAIEVNEMAFDQLIKSFLESCLIQSGYGLKEKIKLFNNDEISLVMKIISKNEEHETFHLNNLSSDRIIQIFRTCSVIPFPLSELNEKKDIFQAWLEKVSEENYYTVFPCLNIIAPQDRFEAFKTNSSVIHNQIIKLFRAEGEVRNRSLEYLRIFFKQHLKDVPRQRIDPLLEFLIENAEQLLLPPDILDEVLELSSALATPNSPKDPIRIYNDLKLAHKKEELLEIQGPLCDIKGNKVRFNLNTWRARKSEQLTFEDLPPNINDQTFEDTLKALFDKWKDRFDSLSKENQREIENLIKETIHFAAANPSQAHVIEALKTLIFSQSEILNLFSLTKSPNKQFNYLLYYLYMIIKAINEAKPEQEENSLFTPQEEKLFYFCTHIGADKKNRKCPTGQKDGLSDLYNALPSMYRVKHKKGLDRDECKVSDFTDSTIEAALEQTLGAESVFNELTGRTESISQQAHQTLYLKNLLLYQLSLLHQLTFDRNTGVLDDRLLELNLEKTLNIILQHLTPMVFKHLKYTVSVELEKAAKINSEISTEAKKLEKLLYSESKHALLEQRRKEGAKKQEERAKELETHLKQPSQEIQDLHLIQQNKWLKQKQQIESEPKKEPEEDKQNPEITRIQTRIKHLEEAKDSYPMTYAVLKAYITSRHKNFAEKDYFVFENDDENSSPIALTDNGVLALLKWTGYFQDADDKF